MANRKHICTAKPQNVRKTANVFSFGNNFLRLCGFLRFCGVKRGLFKDNKKLTPFAKKVYKAVLTIPIGQVRSYKWVAQKAGKPNAMRAVGQILRHNPWPLIIPCHRVICSGGKLGGYSSGRRKKKILLDLEKKIEKDML